MISYRLALRWDAVKNAHGPEPTGRIGRAE